MQKNISQVQTKPADVGQMISSGQKDFLLQNFKNHFHEKVSSFKILKELLSYILNENGVTGIRFMYGIQDLAKPETCLVLMPCSENMASPKSNLPNIMIQEDGYFLHTGVQVPLEETWKILFNHVKHEHTLNPEQNIKTIHRGDFWGVNKLNTFINNPETDTLQFNLGYSPTEGEFSKGIHPVLEAFDAENKNLNIWMDFTSPCPQMCDGGDGLCISTKIVDTLFKNNDETELNILRSFREDLWQTENGHLVEMYYHSSPVIVSAINKHENKEEIYKDLYGNYLKPCLQAIEDGNNPQVLKLYNEVFAHLNDKYSS
ncbi:MAG: hypothetical protein JNM14_00675 [Ferruginibacter sp.]|nr:hypothetical protein [Ferruginibacter sp.]